MFDTKFPSFRTFRLSIFALLLFPSLVMAQSTWRQVSVPSVREAAVSFVTPPAMYGPIHWAIWGGQQTKEKIVSDIKQIYANGGTVYMLNNSRGLRPKYFTTEYLDLVKTAVQECKKLGMKVWIEGDAGYPDGFAGGMISRDYPDLGMQGIVADAKYSVAAGQTLKIPVPVSTLGILVNQRAAVRPVTTTPASAAAVPSEVLPIPADGQFKWTAPGTGTWEVTFVRHVFRSSPTRFVNREDDTNDKDSRYSLIDYLDPEATRTYVKIIFETYEKLVGDEFGKTILGFRGDEPDYTGFMPWSPKLLDTFQKEKGYDLKPYIAQFFANDLTPEAQRAKADYWDIWSSMFRDNFFKIQYDWCRARNMEYMVHLNKEELMMDLIRNEGSFFKEMRYAAVPGIDNLSQIKPGSVTDFPKLASSAAHLFGRPQIWTEQGGGEGQAGKFVADYQFVRGINYMNIRGLTAAPTADVNPAIIGWYARRASYLLAIGRPAAQVALYHPTESMWLGDRQSDSVTVKLVAQLMEKQIDFDYIDTESLVSLFTIEKGGIKNLSGQIYRAIIIPSSTVIPKKMLERLRAFAATGGRVVFVGRTPTMVVDRTFVNPEGPPDLSFATLEIQPDITMKVVAALPKPDVKFETACPSVKYNHNSLKDGEVYFFFNESDQKQSVSSTLAGKGQVQVWDATTGKISAVTGSKAGKGTVSIPLVLGPYESKFIVIGTSLKN